MRKEVHAFNLSKETFKKLEGNARELGVSTSLYLDNYLKSQHIITPHETINNNLNKIEFIVDDGFGDNAAGEIKTSVEQIRIAFKKIL